MSVLAIGTPTRRKLTLEEFYALPEGPPEEFDEGEAICLPEAHTHHEKIQKELFVVLYTLVKEKNLGEVFLPVNVQLDEEHSYAPDLTFLSRENSDRLDQNRGRIIGAPDLVVEIVPPRGGEIRDRVRKFQVYYNAGVHWYWIIEAQTLAIEEYRWQPEGYLCTARSGPGDVFKPGVFPGLEINLQTLISEKAEGE